MERQVRNMTTKGARPAVGNARTRGPSLDGSWLQRPESATLLDHGSACSPVTATVFKTVGRRFTPPPVGSTPTRFRHFYLDLSCMGLVITHSRIFTLAFM